MGLAYPGEGVDPNDYLVWNITNVGKEPIVLTHIGGAYKKDHFMIIPQNQLPLTLKPGEYIIEYNNDLSVIRDELKHLWAIDSLNRTYKAPRKQVKILKKKFRKTIRG